MPVPLDFQEDVKLAQSRGERGDLRLLADEAQGFEWESEGLRLVGEAQFRLKAFPGAKETFETLRKAVPGDVRANLRLGTIYQKLAASGIRRRQGGVSHPFRPGHPPRARRRRPRRADRAEAFSLLGSNAKTRWLDDWRDVAADRPRQRRAWLRASRRCARRPTSMRMPKIWPATIPASMRLPCSRSRAISRRERPIRWEAAFDDPDKAAGALKDRDACAKRIAAALSLTLGIDPVFKVKQDEGDPWPAIARADVLFLTIDKPARIENEYRKALARVRNDPFVGFRRAPEHRNLRVAGLARRQREDGARRHRRGVRRRGQVAGRAGEIVAGRTLHRAHDRQSRPATGKDAVPANRDKRRLRRAR